MNEKAEMNANQEISSFNGPFDELSFYLGRAYYDHIQLLDHLLNETGLKEHLAPGMGQILFNMFEKDNIIIKDLTRSLRCSPSHLTAVLGKMEQAGVIERRKDEKDGRAVRIRLTALGHGLEGKCRSMLRHLNEILTEGMKEDEIFRMKQRLHLIVENIEKYRETPKARDRA